MPNNIAFWAGTAFLAAVLIWLLTRPNNSAGKVVGFIKRYDTKCSTWDPALLVKALFVKGGFFDRTRCPKNLERRVAMAVVILGNFEHHDQANEDWVKNHIPQRGLAALRSGLAGIFDFFHQQLTSGDAILRLMAIMVLVIGLSVLFGLIWKVSSGVVSLAKISISPAPTVSVSQNQSRPAGVPLAMYPTRISLPTPTPTLVPVATVSVLGRVGKMGGLRLSDQDTANITLYLENLYPIVFGGKYKSSSGTADIDGAVAIWSTYTSIEATPDMLAKYKDDFSWYLTQCIDDSNPLATNYFDYFQKLADDFDLDTVSGAREAVEQGLALCRLVTLLGKMYPVPSASQPQIWSVWLSSESGLAQPTKGSDGRLTVDVILTSSLASFGNRNTVLTNAGLDPNSQNPFLEKLLGFSAGKEGGG